MMEAEPQAALNTITDHNSRMHLIMTEALGTTLCLVLRERRENTWT
jgi:hypothetical protein